jgi:hypothetical protein
MLVIPDAAQRLSGIGLAEFLTVAKPIYSRHPWRSPFGPPAAFAFAVLQTQSGSRTRGAVAGPGMTTFMYRRNRVGVTPG